jgi:ribose 1,5-bisphosphokinase
MPGRLIGVVGPSGVGKDSVMSALLAARPGLQTLRRTITRAPEAGGEAYDAVSVDEFERRRERGVFALSWGAHGLFYGVPETVRQQLDQGDVLVNLSRAVLGEADRLFPGFVTLSLTASPEVLAARLAGRGRETPEDIARRLTRSAPVFAEGLNVIAVANDGPLAETVSTILDALYPVSAQRVI